LSIDNVVGFQFVIAEEGPQTKTSCIVEILLQYQCSTSHLNLFVKT